MRISAADLNAYRTALRQIASSAAGYVKGELTHTGSLSVWRTREAAKRAITDSIGNHGEQAQALAGQLFDEVCEAEGIDAVSEMYDDLIDLDMLESSVYFAARYLVEGDRTGFVNECSELADYYVMRSAYENTIRNVARENMRYARIPTGPDTCDWCLMLASRGFVYYTENDAMAGSHKSCDCLCVPGRGGNSFDDATQVEGYDPDEYYALWRKSGFRPPKTNPTMGRMVYNTDGGVKRSKGARRSRRAQLSSGLHNYEREEIWARLNAASGSREALDEAFKDVIGDFIKRGDTLTDQDWVEVGDHYRSLLEEMEKRKRRK